MSYRGKLLFWLLVIPAGCVSIPNVPPPDVDLQARQGVVATPPPGFGTPKSPQKQSAKVQMPTNPPPAPPQHPEPPPVKPSTPTDQYRTAETWIPLEQWCHANGLGVPHRTVAVGGAQYSFSTSNGDFTVRVGSQIALWRGMQLYLGFAPQISGGHPFVHAIDIRKNFLPLLENTLPATLPRVIVIDPGHGGTDVGAPNVNNNHYEKEYTLDWAKRLQTILEANGCTVYLTRKSDVTMNHFDRVGVADEHHADMFVCLHFNSAFPDRKEMGLETYCLTPRGLPSNNTRGYRDEIGSAFPGNAFDAENLRLAFRVHHALLKVNGHNDRGVRRMRFPTVLQLENCPAVYVEGGYLSNPQEAKRIADPAYRERLAEAVAAALLEDSGNATKSIGTAPGAATNAVAKRHAPPESRHE